MSKSNKGGKFERDTCRQLSTWFSDGERDDMFWRSAGSGGMATRRRSKGLQTTGHCGDVAATDEIGRVLLDVVTIELKRGYSKFTFQDSFDKIAGAAVQEWEKHVVQSIGDHELAGSVAWMLIARRDRRGALVYIPFSLFKRLREVGGFQHCPAPCGKFSTEIRFEEGVRRITCFCTTLDNLLKEVTPQHIHKLHEQL